MTIFILLALFLFQSCGIRQETFSIPADLKPRWIGVEYDNPKCPKLNGSELNQEFIVPESGYICTSSSSYKGAYQRKFFLIEAEGKRTPLKAEGNIWLQGVRSQDNPSQDEGQPNCKVSVSEFFYGKEDDPKSNSSVFQNEKFLEIHPECRNVGASYPKKSS